MVTRVNVVRNVVRYYFGRDLPPGGDQVYVSGQELYRFCRVDPRLLGPEAVSGPGRAP
jgi:hypothetical protein